MDIFVDEQPYTSAGQAGQTVGELAHEVSRASSNSPRIVVSLWCDGECVPSDHLDQILARPIADFATLEMQTQPLHALVGVTLTQTMALFKETQDARYRAADLLAEGQAETAMHHLQKFFDLWKQIQDSMLTCARALGTDLDTLTVNGLSVAGLFETLKKLLIELKDSMLNRDFVVLGDILRYEFDEPLAHWLALLDQLHQRSRSRS